MDVGAGGIEWPFKESNEAESDYAGVDRSDAGRAGRLRDAYGMDAGASCWCGVGVCVGCTADHGQIAAWRVVLGSGQGEKAGDDGTLFEDPQSDLCVRGVLSDRSRADARTMAAAGAADCADP